MIGETQLSYKLSRWTFLALLALAIPLVCIPVRGQEKGPATPATPAASDAGDENAAANARARRRNRQSRAGEDRRCRRGTGDRSQDQGTWRSCLIRE